MDDTLTRDRGQEKGAEAGVLFQGASLEKVVVGKEDWLFATQQGGLLNYANITDLPARELQQGTDYIQQMHEWCQKHKKNFLYVIAPDKHKVYGEYYRLVNKMRPDEYGRGQQFVDYIHKTTSVPAVYLRSALLPHKDKGMLYWKNDTHWNHFGAYYGYRKIMECLNLKPLEVTTWGSKPYMGDILRMNPNNGVDYTPIQYKVPIFNETFSRTNHKVYNHPNGIVECTNPKPLHNLKVFVLRDSFSTSLCSYLAQSFSRVTLHWKRHFSAEDLQHIKADYDIVILEQIERITPHSLNHPFPKED